MSCYTRGFSVPRAACGWFAGPGVVQIWADALAVLGWQVMLVAALVFYAMIEVNYGSVLFLKGIWPCFAFRPLVAPVLFFVDAVLRD